MRRRTPDPVLLGSLEEQVMLAVVRTGAEAYGMNVRRELEAVTGRGVTIGSVYATLDRLEAKGMVTSERMPRSGGAHSGQSSTDEVSRRVFSVTSFGIDCLELTRQTRDRLWMGVRLRDTRRYD